MIAHSMGNQILIDALSQAKQAKLQIGKLSEIILASPDVDKDLYLQMGPSLKALANGVTMYASSADRVLEGSELKSEGPRGGLIVDGKPILVDGIEAIDATSLGNDMFAINHSVYAASMSALSDISRIISSGTHPPNLRPREIRAVPEGSDRPEYWRFPQ